MKVILLKGNEAFDITELTTEKTLEGSLDSCVRTFNCSMLSNGIKPENGDHIFLLDGSNKKIFQGIILVLDFKKNDVIDIKAYDNCFYWANNSDTFSFENKSIGEVFVQICNRFGIQRGITEDSNYKIKSLPVQNTGLYDLIKDAAKQTFKATGEHFYIRDNKGKTELVSRRTQRQEWVLETSKNITGYNYSESAKDLKTRVKLVNKDKKKTITAIDTKNDLINKFGVLQHYESTSEKSNQSDLNKKASQMLKEKSRIKKSFSIECLGINDIKSGDSIFINIPERNIKKSLFISKDTHKYFNKLHTMSLTLVETLETED